MYVAFSKKGNSLVVTPVGDIDHHSCTLIRERTDREFIQKRLMDIELDLSEVGFMDSSAIGFIIGRFRLAKSLGGRLYITGVKESCKKLISLSGIEDIIDVKFSGGE